jgi:hypothetical protein
MSRRPNRMLAGVWGAFIAASLTIGCGGSGTGTSEDFSGEIASQTLNLGRPGSRVPHFGEHGFGFGLRGVPGGHGFRGHGGPNKFCDGTAGNAGGKGGAGASGQAGAGGNSGGTGRGGTVGTGGAIGAGGSTSAGGIGGAGGSGGTGGAPPMVCSGTPPARALITDFSDAVVGTAGITFGTAPNLGGATFTYAATGLTQPVLSLVPAPGGSTGQALQVTDGGPVGNGGNGNWSGFGLGFDMCIDASAYTGVQFTITGTIGSCPLTFSPQFSEDNSVTDDPNFGSCVPGSTGCFPPASTPLILGPNTIDFSQVVGGAPDQTVDARALTGVQWQLNGSSCGQNFTVTNVTFINDGSGGMSGGGGGGGTVGGSGAGGRAAGVPSGQAGAPGGAAGTAGGRGGPAGASGGGVGGAAGGVPAPLVCPALATPLVTGSTLSPAGGAFTAAATGLTAPTVTQAIGTDGSIQSLQVSAAPGTSTDPSNAWSVFGFYFSTPACVNADVYTGVKFTVAGYLGTCSLNVFAITGEDNMVVNGGTCTGSSCVSPYSASIGKGTQTVHFTSLSGGIPDPTVDPADIEGIGWTLNVPTDGKTAACAANITVSNVSFIGN